MYHEIISKTAIGTPKGVGGQCLKWRRGVNRNYSEEKMLRTPNRPGSLKNRLFVKLARSSGWYFLENHFILQTARFENKKNARLFYFPFFFYFFKTAHF